MDAEGHLQPGQELCLQLPRSTELFCAEGCVQLVATHQDLPCQTGLLLCTGQGWRAAQPTHLRLRALQASRLRVAPAPGPNKKPRDAGLERVQRLLRGIMRAPRAA